MEGHRGEDHGVPLLELLWVAHSKSQASVWQRRGRASVGRSRGRIAIYSPLVQRRTPRLPAPPLSHDDILATPRCTGTSAIGLHDLGRVLSSFPTDAPKEVT